MADKMQLPVLILVFSGVLVVSGTCINGRNYYAGVNSNGQINGYCPDGCCYEYIDDPCCVRTDAVLVVVGVTIGSLGFVWLVLYVWAGALLKINCLRRLMLPELSEPVQPILPGLSHVGSTQSSSTQGQVTQARNTLNF